MNAGALESCFNILRNIDIIYAFDSGFRGICIVENVTQNKEEEEEGEKEGGNDNKLVSMQISLVIGWCQ